MNWRRLNMYIINKIYMHNIWMAVYLLLNKFRFDIGCSLLNVSSYSLKIELFTLNKMQIKAIFTFYTIDKSFGIHIENEKSIYKFILDFLIFSYVWYDKKNWQFFRYAKSNYYIIFIKIFLSKKFYFSYLCYANINRII